MMACFLVKEKRPSSWEEPVIKGYILVVQGIGVLVEVFLCLVTPAKPCTKFKNIIEHRLMLSFFAKGYIAEKIVEHPQTLIGL